MIHLKTDDKRIIIKAISKEDIYPLWHLSYQEKLEWMKWNGPYFNNPIYSWEEFKEKTLSEVNSEMTALIHYEGTMIGQVFAYWEDKPINNWLEFGVVIYDHDYWGKGIGSEAASLWIPYLFTLYPDIQRVGFTTWSGNIGMMHIGEKIGMVKEAQIRKVRFTQGKYFDSVKYGLLRSEYKQMKVSDE
ncbi:GNAT family N-acetyltransferase [Enterococcus sp. BWM-S5]|uniref:GNAT family N-acetyltransferase n=1 Tax=Enterococcus larvae TaxID=2794352 RepID=A0ABS4CGJ7_9ENTE|nr:GNAT family protein [Enterococcus larvae]MBP1045723.1 GNAT family N-acetyltransferase [Enterococcus larvae]